MKEGSSESFAEDVGPVAALIGSGRSWEAVTAWTLVCRRGETGTALTTALRFIVIVVQNEDVGWDMTHNLCYYTIKQTFI